MKAMKSLLLRMPESMSEEVAAICEELHCGKSQFVRQAIMRNLDIIRQVERPAIMEFYRKRLPNLH